MKHMVEIYKKVIRELPFSITEYAEFEVELYRFFDRLCEIGYFSEGTSGQLEFNFVMAGFMHVENRNEWKLGSFSRLYYNSFTSADKLLLLSIYYRFCFTKHQVDKYGGTSSVLANLFTHDVDFQISLNQEENAHARYISRERVLEVYIPLKLFRVDVSNREVGYIQKIFNDLKKRIEDENGQLPVLVSNISDRNYPNTVVINRGVEADKLDKLLHEIICIEEIEDIISDLQRDFNGINSNHKELFISSTSKRNRLLHDLGMSCIALSIICLYYKCKVEYMMSIAKVDSFDQDKKLFRNLGGLIVGYPETIELQSEDRVLLNIISDHITSVVAGGYLVRDIDDKKQLEVVYQEWNKKSKREAVKQLSGVYREKRLSDNWEGIEESVSILADRLVQDFKNINLKSYTKSPNKICNHTHHYHRRTKEVTDIHFKQFLLCRRLTLYILHSTLAQEIDCPKALADDRIHLAYHIITRSSYIKRESLDPSILSNFANGMILYPDLQQPLVLLPEEFRWLQRNGCILGFKI